MASKEHAEHILPLSLYLKVGATLLVLTVVTVAVAQVHLGPLNVVVAMLIAAAKAGVVALYFMHLKYTSRLYSVVFILSLLMLAVFIIFTMFDTMERGSIDEIKAKPIEERAIIYQQADTTGNAAAAQSQPAETAGH